MPQSNIDKTVANPGRKRKRYGSVRGKIRMRESDGFPFGFAEFAAVGFCNGFGGKSLFF